MGGTKMPDPTQPPILRPVPDKEKVDPLRFCRGIEDGYLTVIIQNEGGAVPADTKVEVEVSFTNKGTHRKNLSKLLSSKGVEELQFLLPENPFDPDCEFDITIFMGGQRHYTTSGICTR